VVLFVGSPRLDKRSRDEDVRQKLEAPDARWDLVVCGEAHKLSATVFGGEIKYTPSAIDSANSYQA
jgi:hypothetical protein